MVCTSGVWPCPAGLTKGQTCASPPISGDASSARSGAAGFSCASVVHRGGVVAADSKAVAFRGSAARLPSLGPADPTPSLSPSGVLPGSCACSSSSLVVGSGLGVRTWSLSVLAAVSAAPGSGVSPFCRGELGLMMGPRTGLGRAGGGEGSASGLAPATDPRSGIGVCSRRELMRPGHQCAARKAGGTELESKLARDSDVQAPRQITPDNARPSGNGH